MDWRLLRAVSDARVLLLELLLLWLRRVLLALRGQLTDEWLVLSLRISKLLLLLIQLAGMRLLLESCGIRMRLLANGRMLLKLLLLLTDAGLLSVTLLDRRAELLLRVGMLSVSLLCSGMNLAILLCLSSSNLRGMHALLAIASLLTRVDLTVSSSSRVTITTLLSWMHSVSLSRMAITRGLLHS